MRPEPTQNDSSLQVIRFGLSDVNPIVVKHFTIPDRIKADPDMHYEMELGIVLSGKIHRFYRDWSTILLPGDVWFSGMWEPHAWENLKTPSSNVILFFSPRTLATLHYDPMPKINPMGPFVVKHNFRPRIPKEKRVDMLLLGRKLLNIYNNPSKYSQSWYNLFLSEILLMVFENWEIDAGQAKIGLDPMGKIYRAIQLVFENKTLISELHAAKVCKMPLNTFNKQFNEVMGVSFARYALQHRIDRVAEQLRKSDKPVKSIAFEWGFTDSSHLRRCFKKYYGYSPSEYRNQ